MTWRADRQSAFQELNKSAFHSLCTDRKTFSALKLLKEILFVLTHDLRWFFLTVFLLKVMKNCFTQRMKDVNNWNRKILSNKDARIFKICPENRALNKLLRPKILISWLNSHQKVTESASTDLKMYSEKLETKERSCLCRPVRKIYAKLNILQASIA